MHIRGEQLSFSIELGECTIFSSKLSNDVITLVCNDRQSLIYAVLTLIESGLPASAVASYPCGPSGYLGEVIMHFPERCVKYPANGSMLVYCSSFEVCQDIAHELAESMASYIKFMKIINEKVALYADMAEGKLINLSIFERINSRGLQAIMIKPIRVPPLKINL